MVSLALGGTQRKSSGKEIGDMVSAWAANRTQAWAVTRKEAGSGWFSISVK